MKDIHGKEIKTNDTIRWCPNGLRTWDEYVVDGVDSNFLAIHNVFGPLVVSVNGGEAEILPERILTKEDFEPNK